MRARCILLALGLLGFACGGNGPEGGDSPDAGGVSSPPDANPYPPPRTNLVPRVGTDDAIDMATWNIENFPQEANSAILVADLIASMDLDLIAVQEIEDIAAFDEVVARLQTYRSVLSSHTYSNGSYQKVGFIHKADLLTVENPVLLFRNEGYDFPRPPLQVTVTVNGLEPALDFVAIALHLKAGVATEDRSRRTAAIVSLETHLRQTVDGSGDDDIVVLGDFNEVLDTAQGQTVFAPLLGEPGRYTMQTNDLAIGGATTFIPADIMLDHAITTSALDDELAGGRTLIPALDDQFTGYLSQISDHLPVVVTMPLAQ